MEHKLKKSLGQHFLKDENIINLIISTLKEQSFTRLLEVGPGGGALTQHLIKIPDIDFKAVELDEEKVAYLNREFPSLQGKIIQNSFLDIDAPFDEPFIVIGNFPYNISSQILFKILEWKDKVPVIIGMFQKEVAQRAAAPPGNKIYGVLSALIQPYYDITYLFDVPPHSFIPPPKVQSGVIKLERRSKEPVYRSESDYRLLVKTAFNQRRKTMRNAVKGLFIPEILQDELFNRRAETLSIEEFAALTFKMS
ncbi:MAG: ribosomal RNA small subunit methyltransferase A [Ferruginibacter sp.]|nr:ribosomal RNA small subunit methyltransferase A [Ferruginibacter sp.]